MRTKKLLLALAIFVSSSVWAEWVVHGAHDVATFYFDPDTIRKDENIRRVWQLQDLKQRGRNGEMSRRHRVEYDCKNERSKNLQASIHSEPMAGGQIIFSFDADDIWKDIPPNTSSASMLRIVCSK